MPTWFCYSASGFLASPNHNMALPGMGGHQQRHQVQVPENAAGQVESQCRHPYSKGPTYSALPVRTGVKMRPCA